MAFLVHSAKKIILVWFGGGGMAPPGPPGSATGYRTDNSVSVRRTMWWWLRLENNASSHSSADSVTDSLKLQAINYLSDSSVSLSSLHSFAAVRTIFICYNTSLASSAALERLLSSARQIATPRRNRLSDISFEKLLMSKINKCE